MKRSLALLLVLALSFQAEAQAPCGEWLAQYHALEARFLATFSGLGERVIRVGEIEASADQLLASPNGGTEARAILERGKRRLQSQFGTHSRIVSLPVKDRQLESLQLSSEGNSPLALFNAKITGPSFGYQSVAFSPWVALATTDGALVNGIESLFVDSLAIQLGRPSPSALHEVSHAWVKRSLNFGRDHLFLGTLESLDAQPISPNLDMLGIYDLRSLVDEPIAYSISLYHALEELVLLENRRDEGARLVRDRIWDSLSTLLLMGSGTAKQVEDMMTAIQKDQAVNEFLDILEWPSLDPSHSAPFETLSAEFTVSGRVSVVLHALDPTLVAAYRQYHASRSEADRETLNSLYEKRVMTVIQISQLVRTLMMSLYPILEQQKHGYTPAFGSTARIITRGLIERLQEEKLIEPLL